jgi:cell division protein FtsN
MGGVHRESDGFWSKVLVSTVVVIWVSLVAGQWAGKWAIEHGKFASHDTGHHEMALEQRPEYQPPPPTAVQVPTESASPEMATPEESGSPDIASPTVEATVTVMPPAESPSGTPSDVASDAPSDSPSPDAATETPVMPVTPQVSGSPDARPWTLQMGVFNTRSNAEKLADELRGKGYSVDVQPEANGGQSTYAVRVGHFPNRAAADDQQGKLQIDGYSPLPIQR